MARLYEKGYKTLSISDAAEYLRRDTPFPERSFAITFDDGYQSVYGEAFPILQRYGFSATIFLTVGQNGPLIAAKRLPAFSKGTMLSWNEIKEMQGSGIRVGAHTVTHPDLTRLPLERLKVEICDSKTIIEDALGIKVDCFAYPFGR
jgi:peptidoglycan/xylan/chitin deacetylase (PgdA/CDA1 family)